MVAVAHVDAANVVVAVVVVAAVVAVVAAAAVNVVVAAAAAKVGGHVGHAQGARWSTALLVRSSCYDRDF